MRNPSDPRNGDNDLRALMGLGERSHRKSYYPELQERLNELERFKAFVDCSHDAIFLIEVPVAHIVDVNQACCRQLGYTRDELLGKSVFDISELEESSQAAELIGNVGPDAATRILVDSVLQRRDASRFPVEFTLARMSFQDSVYVIAVARDITRRKEAEKALLASETDRARLQTQLECAAQMQSYLLPTASPTAEGFDIAASCLPAQQVGGDFYDWQEMSPGLFTVTLGDVMGKGMAAAMLMATVRAALRAVSRASPPRVALQLAEHALRQDLDRSESFVTLFHAQLDAAARRLTFVDCGHGLVFLRRRDGLVEDLHPRGLPLGIPVGTFSDGYREGSVDFDSGDALILYSDGLTDALPEERREKGFLAGRLAGAESAREMVDRLVATVAALGTLPLPDDLTVLVILAQ